MPELTLTELGQRIKAKYPLGVTSSKIPYAKISDEDLARQVIGKHPEYQKWLSTDELKKIAGQVKPTGGGLANSPAGPVAAGGAKALENMAEFSQKYGPYLSPVSALMMPKGAGEAGVDNLKKVSDAVSGETAGYESKHPIMSAVERGVGEVGISLPLMSGAGSMLPTAAKDASLLAKVATGAARGAGEFAAGSPAFSPNASDIPKSAIQGAAFGAASPIAGKALEPLGKRLRQFLGRSTTTSAASASTAVTEDKAATLFKQVVRDKLPHIDTTGDPNAILDKLSPSERQIVYKEYGTRNAAEKHNDARVASYTKKHGAPVPEIEAKLRGTHEEAVQAFADAKAAKIAKPKSIVSATLEDKLAQQNAAVAKKATEREALKSEKAIVNAKAQQAMKEANKLRKTLGGVLSQDHLRRIANGETSDQILGIVPNAPAAVSPSAQEVLTPKLAAEQPQVAPALEVAKSIHEVMKPEPAAAASSEPPAFDGKTLGPRLSEVEHALPQIERQKLALERLRSDAEQKLKDLHASSVPASVKSREQAKIILQAGRIADRFGKGDFSAQRVRTIASKTKDAERATAARVKAAAEASPTGNIVSPASEEGGRADVGHKFDEGKWKDQFFDLWKHPPTEIQLERGRLGQSVGEVVDEVEEMKFMDKHPELFEPSAEPSESAPKSVAPRPVSKQALPGSLAGIKPRYGYKDRNFQLAFSNDTDRVLYTVAQKVKSKSHDAAMAYLKNVFPGESDNAIIKRGQAVKEMIKQKAAVAPKGATTLYLMGD
jgi:hypothetical protein